MGMHPHYNQLFIDQLTMKELVVTQFLARHVILQLHSGVSREESIDATVECKEQARREHTEAISTNCLCAAQHEYDPFVLYAPAGKCQ
jgi:hypothetical protein